ncbi:uncharacterized protein PRCAT00005800001 [Priceomyces carsonii]|uniref:uncharacterized protein n=1 Tax=Priceomyces carsonii TaxID=28549 RepID=UPI002ED88967|nr:unnamed protein product [Priceomyces carsonii]
MKNENKITFESSPRQLEDSTEAKRANLEGDICYNRKLLKKLNLYIIPRVTILYLLSFIDRGNIGNANIE